MLTVDYHRLGLEPGDRLLDIGAGLGRHAFEAFRRGAEVVAVDLRRDDLDACRATFAAMAEAGESLPGAHAGAVCGSVTDLPFADGAFDRVIASEILEHVPDDVAALAELARVVRPGGTIAVTVPAWLAEAVCWRLSEDYHAPAAVGGHVRIYTRTVLETRLRGAGFRPLGVGRAHALHTPYWWLRCAVGIDDDTNRLVRAYHRVLVWDIVRHPLPTRIAEALLRPFVPKSLVLYAVREHARVAA